MYKDVKYYNSFNIFLKLIFIIYVLSSLNVFIYHCYLLKYNKLKLKIILFQF